MRHPSVLNGSVQSRSISGILQPAGKAMQGNPIFCIVMNDSCQRSQPRNRKFSLLKHFSTCGLYRCFAVLQPAAGKFPQTAPHIIGQSLLNIHFILMDNDPAGHDDFDLLFPLYGNGTPVDCSLLQSAAVSGQWTITAARRFRPADQSAELHQRLIKQAGLAPGKEIRRNRLQLFSNRDLLQGLIQIKQSGKDPFHVGIKHRVRFIKGYGEYCRGSVWADTGQGEQQVQIGRDFPAMVFQQQLCCSLNVFYPGIIAQPLPGLY